MLALVLVGALSQLADQVAQAAPPKGEISVAVGGQGRLGAALEELVVGRLREHGRVAQPPPGAADATIECTVAIRGDQVVVEGRVRRVDAELWRAAVGAAGGDVIGRVFVQAPADAEAKSLLTTPQTPNPPTRKFGGTMRSIPLGDVEVVALAVGKNGAISALTEREVLTVREGQPIAHAPIPLAMAPLTSRALMGGIVGPTMGLSTRVGGIPVGLSPEGRVLSATVDLATSALILPPPWPQRIRAAATGTVGGQWFGAAVDENGRLFVYRTVPGNVHFMVPGAGDAVAIWDADGDGDPEVATSARVALGENDEIIVRNARGDVMRKPITGAVTALAASENALYAAVRAPSGKTELWIVQ